MGVFSRPARAVLAVLTGAAMVVAGGAAAQADRQPGVDQSGLPDTTPSTATPNVDDGMVETIAKAGDRVFLGGTFTTARDPGSNAPIARANILAFDARTGKVDQGFAPQVNGEVSQIIAGPENTVYVVGSFTQVNGVKIRVVRLDAESGQITKGWKGSVNNLTTTAALAGGVLYIGGQFNKSGGNAHSEMAALDPATGVDLPWFGVGFAGRHGNGKAQAALAPKKIVVSPDGRQMVVIGNFTSATDGSGTVDRDQVALLDLGPSTASINRDWRTVQFTGLCSTNAFDSWVRDVDIDPTGTYFVISATGGQATSNVDGTKAVCDAASRWELGAHGASIMPTWVSYTGRDTLLSVGISNSAVYVGGHQRWLNNPSGLDNAKEGAVPRPGLGALDPKTGVPLSWNPGRNPRGAGAFALLVADNGVYVGSDTDYIGNYRYRRGRVAFFPIATGTAPASEATGTFPGTIYAVSSLGSPDPAGLRASQATGPTSPGTLQSMGASTTDWSRTRGGFVVGQRMYYGKSDGTFAMRTLEGGTFGAETLVDPYHDPAWSAVLSGSGKTQTYAGASPALYAQFPNVTSMFYADHAIYYTLVGKTQMYSRAFVPESGVMGAQVTVSDGKSWTDVAGAFVVGDSLFYATRTTGALYRVGWVGQRATGSPVLVDNTQNWAARALFVAPKAPNQAPRATFTVSCPQTTLRCTFDGSASRDPDGSVARFDWDFGDGGTAADAGPTVSHDYDAPGTRTVTLTVTDAEGATGSASMSADPTSIPATVGFRDASEAQGTGDSVSVTVPRSVRAGDGLVLVQSFANVKAASTVPAGWELVRTTQSASAFVTKVYQRVATASDAGSMVTVSFGQSGKSSAAILAYYGTDRRSPLGDSAGTVDSASASHTSPPVTPAGPGDWTLTLWQDKAAVAASTWSAPAGVTTRSTLVGGGGGAITQLVADSGGAVPGGTPYGGLTASVDTTSTKGAAVTLVLVANPTAVNLTPTASFTVSCPQGSLACSFDASASEDPDGSVARYDWDFGDGGSASDAGPTVRHSYASAGPHRVSLTVTDTAGATDTVSHDANPTRQSASIAYRDHAEQQLSAASSVTVGIPTTVQPGDALILTTSMNSGSATSTDPDGWTPIASLKNPSGFVTKIYSRVATAGDAGSRVASQFSTTGKITASLVAYSGTDPDRPVVLEADAVDAGSSRHTTPEVTVATPGSWVLSLWQDKANIAASEWQVPAGVTPRSTIVGGGGGAVTQVLGDSGAIVPLGGYGGLVASTNTASLKGATATMVLKAG